MNSTGSKLEDGAWTPAIRQLAIELMDSMLNRPSSIVISDPKNGDKCFQAVRDKLLRRKYLSLQEWNSNVKEIFQNAIDSDDILKQEVAKDLQITFNKEYQILDSLSHFHFRTEMSKIVDKLQDLNSRLAELPQESA